MLKWLFGLASRGSLGTPATDCKNLPATVERIAAGTFAGVAAHGLARWAFGADGRLAYFVTWTLLATTEQVGGTPSESCDHKL